MRRVCGLVAVAVLSAVVTFVRGQEPAGAPKVRHYLPAYWSSVVTQDQRQQCYAIQDKYGAELAALQEQIKALKAKQESEMAALLTPEQRQQIVRVATASKTASQQRKALIGAALAPQPK